ncbi:hypothetical protein JTE90_017484 [Oedothorax gibbosus]|uniref:Uncharacterized protein n=1 Tax=Oedothorax gibbosus TaxID=931172 RepID=A0AAV6UC43_9ARAC|nr:hypothetical protein JTE90_017484 [Oedothorax gibbosus]
MQTDTNQREYVVTTTSTLMRNGLGNGSEPPALTCVPLPIGCSFSASTFSPVLLGPKKCFGTHCRARYQFLHRIVPQQAVWMEFQLAFLEPPPHPHHVLQGPQRPRTSTFVRSVAKEETCNCSSRRDPPTLQGKRRLEECQRPTHQLRHAPMEPPENTPSHQRREERQRRRVMLN